MSLINAKGVAPVTDATFQSEVLGSQTPVLLSFWADWCPHCHVVARILPQIAEERSGLLTVRTINADENQRTVLTYRVMSLPALLLFRDAAPVWSGVGARSAKRLLSDLDTALGG